MPSPHDRWLDEDAGPVVRPYALIRGRTRPTGESLDLIALVTAVRGDARHPASGRDVLVALVEHALDLLGDRPGRAAAVAR